MERMRLMGKNLPEDTASTGVNSEDAVVHTQLDLAFFESTDHAKAWAYMLQLARAVVDEVGLKQVAFDLDMAPSQLSHCLNERERHNLPAKAVPYLVMKAKTNDLVAFLAILRGLQVKPRVELSPQEKLDRLLAKLGEQLGPDVLQLLVDKAYGSKK